MRLQILIAAVIALGVVSHKAVAAGNEGKVEVCVPSDFDWSVYASLDLPANLIFEDDGYFSGSLIQADNEYVERLKSTGADDKDGKELEGAFIISDPVHLTKSQPCGNTEARMIVMVAFRGKHGTAANHHVWLGWRVLGLSPWKDDFGKPGGLPLHLGQVLDDFKVRGMLLGDLGDPVSIDSETQNRLMHSP
jgi:hypothetical protein